MRILIAPDSFKGTFSAEDMAALIKAALPLALQKNATVQPLADGGEGTTRILATAMNASFVQTKATAPLGETIDAEYAIAEQTAFIEAAAASGLTLVKSPLRPDLASTFGTGEVMADALRRGATKLVVGIGGSATVDGGAGVLQALGAKLYDENGNETPRGNIGLEKLSSIDLRGVFVDRAPELVVASDVDNPLLGEQGAIRVFGKQKGVSESDYAAFERRLENFATVVERAVGKSLRNEAGSGAAGGLGFALAALGGKFKSGATLVNDAVGLNEKIKRADLVITGEGKLDATSLGGKVVGHVTRLCERHRKTCWVVCGASNLKEMNGVEKIIALFDAAPETIAQAISETPNRLREKFSMLTL